MGQRNFHVDFFERAYFDSSFSKEDDPSFQLAVDDVDRIAATRPGIDEEADVYRVFSSPANFCGLASAVMDYLQKAGQTYAIRFSDSASVRLGERGMEMLEKIVSLHNLAVSPEGIWPARPVYIE